MDKKVVESDGITDLEILERQRKYGGKNNIKKLSGFKQLIRIRYEPTNALCCSLSNE